MYHLSNRFSCSNNYEQFENSIDFNKEIVHNVTSSNRWTTSKHSTDISCTKERSKEPDRDQITFHNTQQYPVLTVIKNIQKNPRDSKIKTNRLNAPATTIIGDSVITKVFRDKLSRQVNYKHHAAVRSFDGAKAQCTEDYMKSTKQLSPNQKILPCRPNNLPSIAVPETIAKNIINLAKNNKTDIAKVAVSGIIPRRDT